MTVSTEYYYYLVFEVRPPISFLLKVEQVFTFSFRWFQKRFDAAETSSSSCPQTETSSERAATSSAPSGRGRPISVLRQTGSKVAGPRGGPGQKAGHRTVRVTWD